MYVSIHVYVCVWTCMWYLYFCRIGYSFLWSTSNSSLLFDGPPSSYLLFVALAWVSLKEKNFGMGITKREEFWQWVSLKEKNLPSLTPGGPLFGSLFFLAPPWPDALLARTHASTTTFLYLPFSDKISKEIDRLYRMYVP